MKEFKNSGLIVEEMNEKDYRRIGSVVVGALSKKVLFPNGQIPESVLPIPEIQKTDLTDLMNCVSQSLNNCLEISLNAQEFEVYSNKSDRFPARMSNTSRQGNSIRDVAETGRTCGAVEEAEYPYNRDMGWDEYYKSVPQSVKDKGLKFLENYNINWEWIGTGARDLMENLKFSCIKGNF